jgi:hypothetical protein
MLLAFLHLNVDQLGRHLPPKGFPPRRPVLSQYPKWAEKYRFKPLLVKREPAKTPQQRQTEEEEDHEQERNTNR